jgi:hypothetical protein
MNLKKFVITLKNLIKNILLWFLWKNDYECIYKYYQDEENVNNIHLHEYDVDRLKQLDIQLKEWKK